MAAHRRFVAHTAVSSARSLYHFFSSRNFASHFYVDAYGRVEQYVDTKYRAPAQRQGNADSISIESQDMGGPFPSWGGSNVPAWTDAQVDAIVKLIRWLGRTHHIPASMLDSSHYGTRGCGWHRIGIDGNFPSSGILRGRLQRGGGQKWSGHYGKVCPGDRRIRQMPIIIDLAQEDGMATMRKMLRDLWEGRRPKVESKVSGNEVRAVAQDSWGHYRARQSLVQGQETHDLLTTPQTFKYWENGEEKESEATPIEMLGWIMTRTNELGYRLEQLEKENDS